MNGSRVYCDIFNEEGGVAIGVSVDGHEVLLEQRCADFPGTTRHSGWMGDLRVWGDSIQHSTSAGMDQCPVLCPLRVVGGLRSGCRAWRRGRGVQAWQRCVRGRGREKGSRESRDMRSRKDR